VTHDPYHDGSGRGVGLDVMARCLSANFAPGASGCSRILSAVWGNTGGSCWRKQRFRWSQACRSRSVNPSRKLRRFESFTCHHVRKGPLTCGNAGQGPLRVPGGGIESGAASEVVSLGHVVLQLGGRIELFLTLALNTPTYCYAYHDATVDGLTQLTKLMGIADSGGLR
jgi:hypothetical protein